MLSHYKQGGWVTAVSFNAFDVTQTKRFGVEEVEPLCI